MQAEVWSVGLVIGKPGLLAPEQSEDHIQTISVYGETQHVSS